MVGVAGLKKRIKSINLKSLFRRWLLRLMFTPVRAVKLERARVRAEERLRSVSGSVFTSDEIAGFSSLSLCYDNSCDMFRYSREEYGMFAAERQILEDMIG
jgi:hypothetical protein